MGLLDTITDKLYFKKDDYKDFSTDIPSVDKFENVTPKYLVEALEAHGHIIYDDPYKINIVGVRYSQEFSNRFDDLITVFWRNRDGLWVFRKYNATTDPGLHYTQNFANIGGTAILKEGQYVDCYQIGLHQGKYPALTQRKPVTVWRDADRDSIHTYVKHETGFFGINIHRATPNGTSLLVDKWSAGCQVFANSKDWNEFMDICTNHRGYYGNVFTYTLIGRDDL